MIPKTMVIMLVGYWGKKVCLRAGEKVGEMVEKLGTWKVSWLALVLVQ
jgi:hypothetical protein